jgi:polyisoprenoid-binding protein YceI
MKSIIIIILICIITGCNRLSDKPDKKDLKHIAGTEDVDTSERNIDISTKADITKWKADEDQAKINFKIKGPFGTVNGNLKGLKATIIFDEKDLASSFIEASVDANTIDTDNNLRDKDLKKEKFLHIKGHPVINFRSSMIEKKENSYKVTGDLTLKGIKKQVAIPFDFIPKENGGIFKGSFTIDRNNFNIGKEGGTVGKTITVFLEVPVTKY